MKTTITQEMINQLKQSYKNVGREFVSVKEISSWMGFVTGEVVFTFRGKQYVEKHTLNTLNVNMD